MRLIDAEDFQKLIENRISIFAKRQIESSSEEAGLAVGILLGVKELLKVQSTIEAIVPPFKLGDTVYWLNGMGFIKEYKILAIQYTFDDKRKEWRVDLGDLMPIYPHKALYLDKEEAKKAAEIERKRFEEFFKEGAQMDEGATDDV